MSSARHILALSLVGLIGCYGDSPWETLQHLLGSGERPPGHHDAETGEQTANVVDWTTPFVKFRADDLRIEASGKTFLGQVADAELGGDPGTPAEYMTLERIWTEHGVEMRLFIYFYSDGTDWWAGEIRIYDGQRNGEWFAATGEWFRSPLGQSFSGDLDLTLGEPYWRDADGGARGQGHLTMRGLVLQAFATNGDCVGDSAGYGIEILYPIIEMTTAPDTGYGVSVRLQNQCEYVKDIADFEFVWSVDDPQIATITELLLGTSNAQLRGLQPGTTTLRVAVQRRTDETVLAQAAMKVIVTAATQ